MNQEMGRESRWSLSQKSAILTRGRSILVAAGAGSGKTSVLVERVVQSVLGENASDLDRLLVVTFTEAAAAEMRERVGTRLEQMRTVALRDGNEALMRRVSRQLGRLEQAQISTLHSFCLQVVRRNFLTLGLEPEFSLLGDEDGILLRAEVYRDVVERSLEGSNNSGLAAAMRRLTDGDSERLAALVFRLDEFARSQPDPQTWLEQGLQPFVSAAGLSFEQLPWLPGLIAWIRQHLESAIADFSEGITVAKSVPDLHSYAKVLQDSHAVTEQALTTLHPSLDFPTLIEVLRQVFAIKSPRAKDHPDKNRVKSLRQHGLDHLKKVLALIERGSGPLQEDIIALAPVVASLHQLVRDFQGAYGERKRQLGVLDFNDLEHFALQVLENQETGEAERLRSHYEEIYVDEYQDTSPLQDTLIALMTRPTGNVFCVGDVKQSIYRFRMAEPDLFLQRYRQGRRVSEVDENGAEEGLVPSVNSGEVVRRDSLTWAVIDLKDNYRSRVQIVWAVNYVFQRVFAESVGGLSYDASAEMQSLADYPDAPDDGFSLAGPVEFHWVERLDVMNADLFDDEGGQGEEVEFSAQDLSAIEKETTVLAQRILELTGRSPDLHPHLVWDKEQGRYRPLNYRDIVVLMRSVKGRINPVLEVLQRFEIPAYGATSSGFYGALEVQWLLSALSALDNPHRELALVAWMRSPLAGFTDDELARIRMASKGNFYSCVTAVTNNQIPEIWQDMPQLRVQPLVGDTSRCGDEWADRLIHKVERFVHRLHRWRSLARALPSAGVLRTILDETGFLHYVSGMRGGRVRVANIQLLLQRARDFDARSVDGIYGFVRHADRVLAEEADAGEARTLGEQENVVRVMTIHQSKGLEFPVVFVMDLGKAFYQDPLSRIFPIHRELGFGPLQSDPATDQRWPTVPSVVVENAELREFLAEEARILYVAMTRARERLILIGSARELAQRVVKAQRVLQRRDTALPESYLLESRSYLDWLFAVLLDHPVGEGLLALTRGASVSGAGESDGTDVKTLETAEFVDEEKIGFAMTVWNLKDGSALPTADTSAEWGKVEREVLRKGADIVHFRDALQRAVIRGLESEASPMFTTGSDTHEGENRGNREVQETGFQVFQPTNFSLPPAKLSATDLRRLWASKLQRSSASDSGLNGPHSSRQRGGGFHNSKAAEHLLEEPSFARAGRLLGRERGTAFHTLMQYIQFQTDFDSNGVQRAVADLLRRRVIPASIVQETSVAQVVEFFRSSLGQRLRTAMRVWRELPFFHRINLSRDEGGEGTQVWAGFTPKEQGLLETPNLGRKGWEFVTVQGVIDCLAELPEQWLLIDYKTDRIEVDDVHQTAQEYAGQIGVYLEAVQQATEGSGKPLEAWLYFAEPGRAVRLQSVPKGRDILLSKGFDGNRGGIRVHLSEN